MRRGVCKNKYIQVIDNNALRHYDRVAESYFEIMAYMAIIR